MNAPGTLQGFQHYPNELWLDAICDEVRQFGVEFVFKDDIYTRFKQIQLHDIGLYYRGMAALALLKVPLRQFEAAVKTVAYSDDGEELPRPQTGTELLAAEFLPLQVLVQGLMHEGMILFGGKSKRGKSWLMLDLALAIATGRPAFGHFPCQEPAPVLYIALEDSDRRIRRRLTAIQPNIQRIDNFHLLYDFPKLREGGIERLIRYIERYQYQLVIIDVLAKLESTGEEGTKSYLEVYDMFTPLQELLRQHHFCLTMLTHLRKQAADDVFDSLMGSVAYQGAQDVLWVLERRPKDNDALLHIRDKDVEDNIVALQFFDGHWKYLGEGEAYSQDQQRRAIMLVLAEEAREMSISEIRKACGFPEEQEANLRKILMTMVNEDLIHRARQGKYMATIRGAQKHAQEREDLGVEI